MSIKFDGRKIQEEILAKIKKRLGKIDYQPTLAVIWVGNDPISARYVAIKQRIAEDLGIHFDIYKYPTDLKIEELISKIGELNSTKNVDGIMIQMPLPSRIDSRRIISEIDSKKDVDGLRMCADLVCEIRPPVIKSVLMAIKSSGADIKKSKIAIVGKGFLVGAPLIKILQQLALELNVADVETPYIGTMTADADIVISAVGKAGLITPDIVKDGVVIVDAGTSEVGGELRGDVEPEVYKKASFYTPVPGGIGPVTVAMLFDNLLETIEEKHEKT